MENCQTEIVEFEKEAIFFLSRVPTDLREFCTFCLWFLSFQIFFLKAKLTEATSGPSTLTTALFMLSNNFLLLMKKSKFPKRHSRSSEI